MVIDPSKTIQHYLMDLQRHERTQKKNAVNFRVDAEFLPLRNLLDALYPRLHAEGLLALAQSLKSFTHFFVSAFVSLGGTKPRCNSSKSSSAFNNSNYPRIFRVAIFGKRTPMLMSTLWTSASLYAFQGCIHCLCGSWAGSSFLEMAQEAKEGGGET